jgi:uncharacterized Zn finger protein (UPF0148 family)
VVEVGYVGEAVVLSGREMGMSNMFAVPCPQCGLPMSVRSDGHLECLDCHQAYQARMGFLVALDDRRLVDETAAHAGRALSEPS